MILGMISARKQTRLIWGLLLIVVSLGGLLRLVQTTAPQAPASLDVVVATLKRELVSTVIAGQRVTYEITTYREDRNGAGEVIVAFRYPMVLRQQAGEVIAWYFRHAQVVCRRFGRRFDSSYSSEHPGIEGQTQTVRVDIRYWISPPTSKR